MLSSVTIRDFSGGLNVIDSDFNLSSRFSRVEENIYTATDGSKKVRFGTKLFRTMSNKSLTVRNITNIASNTDGYVIITDENHGLLSGHRITITGLTVDVGTISKDLINGIEFVIERVDEDSYKIKVAESATDVSVVTDYTVSFDNKNIHGRIVNFLYFINKFVIVSSSGQVIIIEKDGSQLVIFNEDIAISLGANAGWSETNYCTMEIFNGQLTLWNGIDKPLIVDFENLSRPCQYLSDPATNSNANVPICKYAVTINHYLVAFGDPINPDRVHISMRDASGVWYGDLDSDGVYIDLGKIVSTDDITIRGGTRFRDKLIIAFDNKVCVGTLGNYVTVGDVTTHEPEFETVIDNVGTISHRSINVFNNVTAMCDVVGTASVKSSTLSGTLSGERISTLIDPLMQEKISLLNIENAEDYVFSINDVKKYNYMLFIPNSNVYEEITETYCFVYSYSSNNSKPTWTLFRDWNFDCGCTDTNKTIYFAKGCNIYVYGNDENPIYADYVDDVDKNEDLTGINIDFNWVSTWIDFNSRSNIKKCKYLNVETSGNSAFDFELYIDNFYGIKYDATFPAEGEVELVGGDSTGFGADGLFGGGRRTSDERLLYFPVKFNICKFRIKGSTKKPLNIVSITLSLSKGGIRR